MKFGATMRDEICYWFRIRLRKLGDSWQNRPDEVERLVEYSREYERFGDFLMCCGCKTEAFRQYASAAQVCLLCSDIHWSQSERGYVLCRRLRERFCMMYDICRRMMKENEELKSIARKLELEKDFRSIR